MTGDRIPCINPKCRRTAPADKVEPGTEIVCGKCWRTLPKHVARRYRALARLSKRIERLVRKEPALTARVVRLAGLARRVEKLQAKNWAAIRACFIAPEKPEGLDAFLEEMGLT